MKSFSYIYHVFLVSIDRHSLAKMLMIWNRLGADWKNCKPVVLFIVPNYMVYCEISSTVMLEKEIPLIALYL